MTAREAIAIVNDHLELANAKPMENGLALRLLRSYAVDISKELRAPTRYHKAQETGAAFAFYDDMLDGGLEYVELDDHEIAEDDWWQHPIPFMTVREANYRYPNWERNELEGYDKFHTRLLIYDPRNKDNGFYPIGFEPGEHIRLLYVMKTNLVVLDDELWDGRLSEWHEIIWRTLLWKALFYSNLEAQSQAEWGHLRTLKEEAFNNINDFYHRRSNKCP